MEARESTPTLFFVSTFLQRVLGFFVLVSRVVGTHVALGKAESGLHGAVGALAQLMCCTVPGESLLGPVLPLGRLRDSKLLLASGDHWPGLFTSLKVGLTTAV